MKDLQTIRTELIELYDTKDNITSSINAKTALYLAMLDDSQPCLYVSDHAIVRYLERVKGIELPTTELSDYDTLMSLNIDIESVRKEIVSIEQSREILRRQYRYFRLNGYSLIIKNLTIVTVILN